MIPMRMGTGDGCEGAPIQSRQNRVDMVGKVRTGIDDYQLVVADQIGG